MITKKITPLFHDKKGDTAYNMEGNDLIPMYITGVRVEYRFSGIIFYSKTMYNPGYYGMHCYEIFTPNI